MVAASVPPYGVPAPSFQFPALATRAARGQLGGDRELALAAYVAARLVAGARVMPPLPAAERGPRAHHARAYFAALSLPPAARTAYARLADATGGDDDVALLAAGLRGVIEVSSRALSVAAREELEALYRVVVAAKP